MDDKELFPGGAEHAAHNNLGELIESDTQAEVRKFLGQGRLGP